MDIQTTTKTVTEYVFTLSAEDLDAILANGPGRAHFDAQLRRLRNGKAPSPNGKAKGRAGRKPKPKEQAPRAAGKAFRCPDCPRTFETAARLNIHRGRSHKAAAAPAAKSSESS